MPSTDSSAPASVATSSAVAATTGLGPDVTPGTTHDVAHRPSALAEWAWGLDTGEFPRWAGPPRWPGLWVPAILSLVLQVGPLLAPWRSSWRLSVDAQTGGIVVAVALLTIGPVALLFSRKFPGPVVAIVAAAAAGTLLYGGDDWPPYIALGFAIVAALNHGARSWAWISVAAAWVGTLVVALVAGVAWHSYRIAGGTLAILIAFGIGEALRSRREHLEEFRRVASQRRKTVEQAERVRLARELHDVLAHSLSQINVQAGVGLHLMGSKPEMAAVALANIKETSKSALDEVRSVLGILRSDSDPEAPLVPEPDLSRLQALAEAVTQQGVEVTLDNHVTQKPSAAIQLAIYRIVQESLTNVVRHANAKSAAVTVCKEQDDFVIEICDSGNASTPTAVPGRGLIGMRERAELLGGTLHAGPLPSGGFRVEARIPLPEAAS